MYRSHQMNIDAILVPSIAHNLGNKRQFTPMNTQTHRLVSAIYMV